jgi:plasmid stabilization system protein ParE
VIVSFAPEADRDLESIGDYIAHDNPVRAASFMRELRERGLSLRNHPERFPQVGESAGYPLRKLTHAGYLIFYIVTLADVRILRIVHAARDWAEMLPLE